MAQWINLNQNNRSVVASALIFCIVRKNWAYVLTAILTAGWLTKYDCVDFEIFKG